MSLDLIPQMVTHREHRSLAVSLAIDEQRNPTPRGSLAARRALSDEVSEVIARELIFSGQVAPGALLPSEKELTERYGVSRITVRAGLRTLREAGLISVRQGVGAVVLSRTDPMRYGLDRLASLETFAAEAGVELTTEDVEIEEIEADDATAARLQLPAGSPVYVARRAKLHEGSRVAWLVDHVRRDALPLDRVQDAAGASVLDALLADDELAADHAECTIEPVALPDDVARRLTVEPGTVGLLLEDVVHAAGGRVLACCTGWHLHAPGQLPFSVRRRRRLGD